jgi:hypothetical protein
MIAHKITCSISFYAVVMQVNVSNKCVEIQQLQVYTSVKYKDGDKSAKMVFLVHVLIKYTL